MVDGRRSTTGAVTQDTLTYTQTSSTSKWRLTRTYATDPERSVVLVKVRFESLDGRRPRRRDRLRPAALQRRQRRRRLDARARAALARQPDRLGARRPPRAHPHQLGLQGPHGRPARAHLRRAAARQRRPAGPHPPDRARHAPRPDAGDRVRHGRHGGAAGRRRLARRRLRRRRLRLQGRLGRSTATSSSRRPAAAVPLLADYETSLLVLKAHEDKDNPGAFVASPSMPWGWGELRIDPDNPRSAPVPPRLGARPLPDRDRAAGGGRQGLGRRRARLPLRRAAARRRLVPAELPGRRHAQVEGRSRWTRSACRSCSPGSSGAPARATGATSARPPTSSPRTGRSPSRSAGRTRRATRRARSRPRSPGWCARRRSRASTATTRGSRPTSSTADAWAGATSSAGRRPRTGRTRTLRTTCA